MSDDWDVHQKVFKAQMDTEEYVRMWVWRLTYLTYGLFGLNFLFLVYLLFRIVKLEGFMPKP